MRLLLRTRAAGAGAGEHRAVGFEETVAYERPEDAFASRGLDAEQTGGLPDGQRETWHFTILTQHAKVEIVFVRRGGGQQGASGVVDRGAHRPLLLENTVGTETATVMSNDGAATM
jgi:hypothetical protein